MLRGMPRTTFNISYMRLKAETFTVEATFFPCMQCNVQSYILTSFMITFRPLYPFYFSEKEEKFIPSDLTLVTL